ncbi:NAD-dependent epimerase/dehydratase family protein [Prosthecochloris sp. ZM_2]|uniref:NAD-dependent epimerase/dehydratase family protein n=1 Tax=Prosthecochloris sp. ZM_2 TaxID=2045206 RepID=UPI000DF7AE09|nr:NAD-dependent epimerase/dehydratase family protein [Prosthecochloris sp. ZM_2]RNA65467.1 NAD-dependent epimerase/dehydratase family protein [Prosthecochloris sp. ZM_2]
MGDNRQVILVTGATGYIGSEVVRALNRRYGDGVQVRALVRPGSSQDALRGEEVERVEGDLLEPLSLLDACHGVSAVFNCAGLIAYSGNYRHRLYRTNVAGTENLVNACLYQGVKRLVHTSSVAAAGVSESGEPATEITPFADWQHRIAYMESKYLAEMEGRRGIAEGLDVVFVNPGVVIGRPSDPEAPLNSSTRAVQAIYRGRMPLYPAGGISIVDVQDVAGAHLAAWVSGVCGERYLVTAGNYSFAELFTMIGELPGSSTRKTFEAPSLLHSVFGVGGELYATLSGTRPYISIESMKLARKKLFYSNRRSVEELGMVYRSVRETLRSICG